jgi:NADH-quinone oxidoreductase subunit L
MLRNAWLIPLLPALSFVVILLFGKRLPRKGAEVGIAAVGASLVMACIAAWQWIDRVEDAAGSGGGEEHARGLAAFGKGLFLGEGGEHAAVEPVTRSITWFQNGGIDIGVGISVDGLTVMMMLVVTIVSFLAHVYSTTYMAGDRRFTHYYAFLSLFTASMLLLVVADNTL